MAVSSLKDRRGRNRGSLWAQRRLRCVRDPRSEPVLSSGLRNTRFRCVRHVLGLGLALAYSLARMAARTDSNRLAHGIRNISSHGLATHSSGRSPAAHSAKFRHQFHHRSPACSALAAAQRLRPSARWERAALPGAPMARRVGGGKSAGRPAWMRASFSPAYGGAVEKPRNPPAHPEPMDGRRARHRGVVSSWLLLLWTSKGEVTRAEAAARNRFETCETSRKSPSPSTSLPQAGEGTTSTTPQRTSNQRPRQRRALNAPTPSP